MRCGHGALRITELQRAGGKRLAVADFLRGFDVKAGMMFEHPPGAPVFFLPTAAALLTTALDLATSARARHWSAS